MLTGDALPSGGARLALVSGLPDIRLVADLKAASAQDGNKAVDLLAAPMVLRRYFQRTNISWCSTCRPRDISPG